MKKALTYLVSAEENPYYQSNSQFFIKLKSIIEENPRRYVQILQRTEIELLTWINLVTPLLQADSYKLNTKCYWVLNGLTDFPICKKCGKKLIDVNVKVTTGYHSYCSKLCQITSKEFYEDRLNTWEKNYGKRITAPSQIKEVVEQQKATCFRNLGVESPMQSQEVQKKSRATKKRNHGNETYVNPEKALETRLTKNKGQFDSEETKAKKRAAANDPAIKAKRIETKRRNHTFKSSKREEEAYELLCSVYGKANIERQYRDQRYPFACDFYIKPFDLYIEYNGTWTHGGCFFDESNTVIMAKLAMWKKKAKTSKYYVNAINTWTIRDVKKRLAAEQNELNYLVFWDMPSLKKFIASFQTKCATGNAMRISA